MAGEDPVKGRPRRPSVRQLMRALVVLARSRRRLRHVPSGAQVAAMARLNGWEPCSYLLDGEVNWLPKAAAQVVAEQASRYGLCFTCVRAGGQLSELNRWALAFSCRPPCGHDAELGLCELVVLDCGWAFDLLGAGNGQLERV